MGKSRISRKPPNEFQQTRWISDTPQQQQKSVKTKEIEYILYEWNNNWIVPDLREAKNF